MDTRKTIKEANKQTAIFFKKAGGKIIKIKILNETTFSSPDEPIPCLNYYIGFCDPLIFGRGDYSNEVYPRYRKMRTDWKKFLLKSKIANFDKIAFGFIPCLLNNHGPHTKKYPAEKISLINKVVLINKLESVYFKKIKKIFRLRFALMEKGGLLIGPEGGMLTTLDAAGRFFKHIDNFVDIGAGTGELSAYLMHHYNINRVVINEISSSLRNHLRDYLGKVSRQNNTKIDFQFNDCRDMKVPNHSNLISLGVFYGFQPSFVKYKGKAIQSALGNDGVLVIQSAMPESTFNYHLLMGNEKGLQGWPWYHRTMQLSTYFKYFKTFYIDNQFVTIASQSPLTLKGILLNIKNKITIIN
jgi:SAM-dependent methyltransferase